MNELTVSKELKDGVFILGTDEKNLMVKYTDKGACQSIKKMVRLLKSKKHFYETYKDSGVFDFSLHAYKAVNKYLNLDDLSPRNFTLDGETYTNPSIKRDGMGRKTLIKGLAVIGGRGPTGKYQIVSRYLEEDIQFGLIQAIVKKLKYNKGLANYVPKGSKAAQGKVIMPVDDIVSLEVNMADNAFREVYSKYVDDLQIGERKLESKVWRNAFKNHPAVLFPACVPIPLYDNDDKVCDYFIDVTITIWLEEIDKDKQDAVDEFFECLDDETVIVDQTDAVDESDLSEEELEEIEDLEEVVEKAVVDNVVTPEMADVIKYIRTAPVDVDLNSINDGELESWSLEELNQGKILINKKVGEM